MEAFFSEDLKEKDQPIASLLTPGCVRTLPGSRFCPSQYDPGGFKVTSLTSGLLPPLCPRMELLCAIKPFVDKKGGKMGLLPIFSSDLQLNLSQIPSYNENREAMFSEENFIRYLHSITCLTSPIF